jgi:hypothetical protein
MNVQLTLAEASRTETTINTISPSETGPEVSIDDDGRPEPCTCVWPDAVDRVDVLLGHNAANQERRRVIDQCQDCGGEVQ